MLSFKKNKHSHVPPAQKSNRTFCGDRNILNLLSSLSLLQTHQTFRSHSMPSDGSHFSHSSACNFSVVFHLVLGQLHCCLYICTVQTLQRHSLTSPLFSVLLWSPQLVFPFEDRGPLHGVPFTWGSC